MSSTNATAHRSRSTARRRSTSSELGRVAAENGSPRNRRGRAKHADARAQLVANAPPVDSRAGGPRGNDRLVSVDRRTPDRPECLLRTRRPTDRDRRHDVDPRLPSSEGSPLKTDLREIAEVAQNMLTHVRSLSQTLHPSILEQAGLEGTIDWYLSTVERQTGLNVFYERDGPPIAIDGTTSIHVYRARKGRR